MPEINDEIYRVATMYLDDGMPQADIARELEVSVSSVSRRLQAAREAGIIRESLVSRQELAAVPVSESQRQKAEQELERRLFLRKAIVLGVPETMAGTTGFSREHDDKLAQMIGQAAAGVLHSLLRDGDIVGIGGGRSVYFTAVELRERRRDARNVTVVSMAGGTGVYDFADGKASFVSADLCTILVADAFNSMHKFTSRLDAYREQRSDLKWNWHFDADSAKKPNIAVVGLGTIAPGIYTCFDQMRHELDPFGRELAERLVRQAGEISRQVNASANQVDHSGSVLADILGLPFVPELPHSVEDLIEGRLLKKLRGDAELMATLVNACPPEQLRTIDSLLVVCGGVRKARPIWHLFRNILRTHEDLARWKHSIVTDYWTACKTLSFLDETALEESSPEKSRTAAA